MVPRKQGSISRKLGSISRKARWISRNARSILENRWSIPIHEDRATKKQAKQKKKPMKSRKLQDSPCFSKNPRYSQTCPKGSKLFNFFNKYTCHRCSCVRFFGRTRFHDFTCFDTRLSSILLDLFNLCLYIPRV